MKRFFLRIFAIILVLLIMACSKLSDVKEIKVAVWPYSAPLSFYNNGKLVGAEMDIFKGYCQSRGYSYKVTEYDWAGMLSAVASGKADMAFSAISITDRRKETMDFSQPYRSNAWHLVSMKNRNIQITNLNQLNKYSIGFPLGMVYDEFIRDEAAPNNFHSLSRIKDYSSYVELLADLRSGKLDLAFMDEHLFLNYKNRLHFPIQSSYVTNNLDRLGFAFPKNSELRDDFNKYLDELGPDKINIIFDKWTQ